MLFMYIINCFLHNSFIKGIWARGDRFSKTVSLFSKSKGPRCPRDRPECQASFLGYFLKVTNFLFAFAEYIGRMTKSKKPQT